MGARRLAYVCAGALVAVCADAVTVKVDFNDRIGIVKPVNGVGQPPMIGAPREFPLMHYLKEAGIPYSRLHDVDGWFGKGLYVDIPNVFPDFDADVDAPSSYRFAFTDALLKSLDENGVEPFFRLGVTIENFVSYGYAARRTFPPKDFLRWSRICEHVIRHYTEGWADGYRMKITHWEIWNEPDNDPDASRNPMWQASFAEYLRLYGVAAPYLKAKFPHLKIGGYGSCGFYAAVGTEGVVDANVSTRLDYFVTCAREFLSAVRTNGWPLDFFSFHSYSTPTQALAQVRFADRLLSEYGFDAGKTERVFDEWMTYISHDLMGSAFQAAGIAAELVGLQNSPCDVACIYDARCSTGIYSPLFNPLTYRPHKAYYAFVSFNELRKRGVAVRASVSGGDGSLAVAAARGNEDGVVMVVNDSESACPLSLDAGRFAPVCVRLTDKDRTDTTMLLPERMPPHSFMVVFCKPQRDAPEQRETKP